MENEWTEIMSVIKADLEMYYARDHNMFNDYHKPLSRNYYFDTKQPLPYNIFKRVNDPDSGTKTPCKPVVH